MKQQGLLTTFITLSLVLSTQVSARENKGAGFGGPNAVENTIEDDSGTDEAFFKQRLIQPWLNWKTRMQEQHGLSLGIDYTAVGLHANEDGASGDDTSGSGMVRFYGSWELFGRGTANSGALVYKVEHRHRYTDVSVQNFGFDQGHVGLLGAPYSDQGGRVTNLYWRQRLNNGRATMVAGMLDATDYVDVYALGSPWNGFLNFAFSTGSASMFIPNDATFGAAGATMLTDNIFVIGGIVNAYTDPTDPFDTVNEFFSENEYFTSLEFGLTQSQGRIFQDNMHVTLWHVDESIPAGTPGGWGVAFNYSRSIYEERVMPFIRGGYANDGGTLLEKSVSLGLAYNLYGGRDQFGMAVNWGEPNENSYGPGLDDQYVFETYYRWQLTEEFAITPDIQYLKDPALNTEEDSLLIFGLRIRLAL